MELKKNLKYSLFSFLQEQIFDDIIKLQPNINK